MESPEPKIFQPYRPRRSPHFWAGVFETGVATAIFAYSDWWLAAIWLAFAALSFATDHKQGKA